MNEMRALKMPFQVRGEGAADIVSRSLHFWVRVLPGGDEVSRTSRVVMLPDRCGSPGAEVEGQ